MSKNTIHRMMKDLGDLLYSGIDGPLTVVGILTGGEYMSKDLAEYLCQKGRICHTFNIMVDKENKQVVNGERIKSDGTTYVFVDDAVWSSRTRDIVIECAERIGVNYRYAVLLDPFKKADFSLFSD